LSKGEERIMATATSTSKEFAITALDTQIRFLLCTLQRNSQMSVPPHPDLLEKLERLQEQLETCKGCGMESRRSDPWCPRMCASAP
jgi:hypothetical protein